MLLNQVSNQQQLAQLPSTNSQSSAPGPSGVVSSSPLNRPGPSRQSASSSAINIVQMRQVSEHKRLFSFGNTAGKRKASKRGKEKKQPTCTLKFVALSEVHALKPPTKIRDRTALQNAGLGEGSIQFCLDMNTVQCHEKILERFPKFQTTGYEMLLYQRGEDSGFIKMEGPQTPRWIKDAAGNAKIYLRPLQRDLDLDNEENADDLQVTTYNKLSSYILFYIFSTQWQNKSKCIESKFVKVNTQSYGSMCVCVCVCGGLVCK